MEDLYISLTDKGDFKVISETIESIESERKWDIDTQKIQSNKLRNLLFVCGFASLGKSTLIEMINQQELCSEPLVFTPIGNTKRNELKEFPSSSKLPLMPLTPIHVGPYSEIPNNRRQRRLEAKKLKRK